MSRICLLSSLALALALTPAVGGDWPRFRGPNGTGVAEGPLPQIDPKKPLWKVALPGKGNGSPIVVAGKVYLQSSSADGKSRALVCVNAADGKIDWTKDVPAEVGKTHPKNSMASGTPACDGQRIYCQTPTTSPARNCGAPRWAATSASTAPASPRWSTPVWCS
jgi:outer membrane protein assembly factor BamB